MNLFRFKKTLLDRIKSQIPSVKQGLSNNEYSLLILLIDKCDEKNLSVSISLNDLSKEMHLAINTIKSCREKLKLLGLICFVKDENNATTYTICDFINNPISKSIIMEKQHFNEEIGQDEATIQEQQNVLPVQFVNENNDANAINDAFDSENEFCDMADQSCEQNEQIVMPTDETKPLQLNNQQTEVMTALCKLLAEQKEERLLVYQCMRVFDDSEKDEWDLNEIRSMLETLHVLSSKINDFQKKNFPNYCFEVKVIIDQLIVELMMFFNDKYRRLTGNRAENTQEALDYLFLDSDTNCFVDFSFSSHLSTEIVKIQINERFKNGLLV